MYERTTTGSTLQPTLKTIKHVDFIYNGSGNAFAVRVMADDGTVTGNSYFNFDHLGSTTAISDDNGHIANATGPDAGILGYDPWGARRNPDGQPATPASFNPEVGHREFTGHEAIPDVGLVNMNGRVYDPVIGRFLSPDPNIQAPQDLQNYNRYSYVLNNPLSYTDPTGYEFLGLSGTGWATLGLSIAGIAACAGSGGAGCGMLFAVAAAAANATSAVLAGATVDQVAGTVILSLGLGAIGGAFGAGAAESLGRGVGAQVFGGALGGALAGALSSVMSGQGHLGLNMLVGATTGALAAGATIAARQSAIVSKASAAAAEGGGGSGASRLESLHRFLEGGGYQLSDPTDPGVTGGPFAMNADPLSVSLEDIPGCNSSPCAISDAPPDWRPNLETLYRPDGGHHGVFFIGFQGVAGIATGGYSASFGLAFDLNGGAGVVLSGGVRLGPQFGAALGPTVSVNPFLGSVYQLEGPYSSLNVDTGFWGGGTAGTVLPPSGASVGFSPPMKLRLPSLGWYAGVTAEVGYTHVWGL